MCALHHSPLAAYESWRSAVGAGLRAWRPRGPKPFSPPKVAFRYKGDPPLSLLLYGRDLALAPAPKGENMPHGWEGSAMGHIMRHGALVVWWMPLVDPRGRGQGGRLNGRWSRAVGRRGLQLEAPPINCSKLLKLQKIVGHNPNPHDSARPTLPFPHAPHSMHQSTSKAGVKVVRDANNITKRLGLL